MAESDGWKRVGVVPVPPPAPTLPEAQSVTLRWVTKVIEQPEGDGTDTTHAVAAYVYGPLAIFKSWSKNAVGKRALVHTASGNRILWLTQDQTLRKVAEFMMSRFANIMHVQTSDEAKARMPAWLRPWLNEMEKQDRWVDPPV